MIHDQSRNIVVADTQNVDRQIFSMGQQMIMTLVELDAACAEEFFGLVGKASRFLNGYAQALFFVACITTCCAIAHGVLCNYPIDYV